MLISSGVVDLLSIEPGGGLVCPPVPLCQVGELGEAAGCDVRG